MTSIIKVDQIQNAAGGVPTAGDLGLNTTGTVLQAVRNGNLNSVHISTTSTSFTATGIYVDITPKKIGSTILIDFYSGMVHQVTAGEMYTKMYVNGSELPGSGVWSAGYANSGTPAIYHSIVHGSSMTTTSLSSLRFEVYFKSTTSSGSSRIVHANSSYAVTATEIAG